MSAISVKFTEPQAAMLRYYPPCYAVEGKNTDLVVYEKFSMQNGLILPAFTKGANTYQAFVVSRTNEGTKLVTVGNGKARFVECVVINPQGKMEVKEKEVFFHSGKIINVIALAYFTTLEGEKKYLSLNGHKAPGGSLEDSDVLNEDLPSAVAHGALREFAEEMLGLNRAEAKKMNLEDLKNYIQTTTKCEKVAGSILIRNHAGMFERLPEKEFNYLMLSPPVMINLGICSTEHIQKALKQEEGKKDIPQIIDEATASDKGFRNAVQVKWHKNNPDAGISF
ncbi:MAG: hypothetical protein Q8L98_01380 [Chlamydiales bacterium]|nr:hypothetical protein [Chlamydiales bacterium]